MALNKNIFCATNPARMSDALWKLICDSGVELRDMLIFLPSRRAVRSVEKMLVARAGHAIILPRLVALGEGADDELPPDDADTADVNIISNLSRVVVTAKLLTADSSVNSMAAALPLAHDLVRMADYMENEGVNIADIDWDNLVDARYAGHFQHKAKLLKIISGFAAGLGPDVVTVAAARNQGIRDWIGMLDKYKLVVVCASTASVPATADLMVAVAGRSHGRIILSGRIDGNIADFELNTNPYNSEYKFLTRVGCGATDVIPIDVGASAIEFMNHAFGNNSVRAACGDAVSHCHLIECAREAEEAYAVAEIAARAVADNKTVLVITPDAAGNQRIAAALGARGISTDFSSGVSGTMTPVGRAILNQFDDWIESGANTFDKLYADSNFDLMQTVVRMVDGGVCEFAPQFNISDDVSVQVWRAIQELSACLGEHDLRVSVADARALLGDVIGGVSVRPAINNDASVVVIGTIESRMQSADVVILTGLNDGMFPARGYENSWLPRRTADEIGLPSPDKKVSLMALDFMNLSCGPDVYWLRSRASGGAQTTESRFLSRVRVAGGRYDTMAGDDILNAVRARDNVASQPLDYSPPQPPADWSDVYVTELELLIHNPYAFYVRHILRLSPLRDYWEGVDVRDFGILVHNVIERARDFSTDSLIAEMDRAAHEKLGADSILFHFWHKRIVEIAPVVSDLLAAVTDARAEIGGSVKIAGRVVCARADRIWDGVVMDIKTGSAPNVKQLALGNMPQLPLEAYILQQGGFPIRMTEQSKTPVMMFLQLKSKDVRPICYDAETTAMMIRAAVDKVTGLFNMYSAGGAEYKYRETGEKKYQAYDDLARNHD